MNVHVIKVQVDRQIAKYHSSPSCSCSSTSKLCGDPCPTPRAASMAKNQASPTRAKPPQLDRAAVCGHNLPNSRARRNWAVWLSCHGLDSISRAALITFPTHAVRLNCALISPSRNFLFVCAHRIARLMVFFHVTVLHRC